MPEQETTSQATQGSQTQPPEGAKTSGETEPKFSEGIGDLEFTAEPPEGEEEKTAPEPPPPPPPQEPPFAPPPTYPYPPPYPPPYPFAPYPFPPPYPYPGMPPQMAQPQEEQWSWEKALTESGYVERFVSRAVQRERAQLQAALAEIQEQVQTESFRAGIKSAEPVLASFIKEHYHELRDPKVMETFRSALTNMAYIAAENADATPFTKREMYAALLAMAKEQAVRQTPRSVQGRTAEVLDQRRGQSPGVDTGAVQIEPWEEQLMREWGISREDWIKNKLGK